MNRVAIELSGYLGALYDGCTDMILKRGETIGVEKPVHSQETKIKSGVFKIKSEFNNQIQNPLNSIDIENGLRLSVSLNDAQRLGIVACMNYSIPFDEHTRLLRYTYVDREEQILDDSSHISSGDELSECCSSATHVIIGVNIGIDIVAIIQLPCNVQQTKLIDDALHRNFTALCKTGHIFKLSSEDEILLQGIVHMKVYSNTLEVQQITTIMDIFHFIQDRQINDMNDPVSYKLRPIVRLRTTDHEFNATFVTLSEDLSMSIAQLVLGLNDDMKRLEISIQHDLPILLDGELNDQMSELKNNFSNLNRKYIDEIQQYRKLVIEVRRGQIPMITVDQIYNRQELISVQNDIRDLQINRDRLQEKAHFINTLKRENFHYLNVASCNINEKDTMDSIRSKLIMDNAFKYVLCSNDELNIVKAIELCQLRCIMVDDLKRNSNLQLIYADFSYSNFQLCGIIQLSTNEKLNPSKLNVTHLDSSIQPLLSSFEIPLPTARNSLEQLPKMNVRCLSHPIVDRLGSKTENVQSDESLQQQIVADSSKASETDELFNLSLRETAMHARRPDKTKQLFSSLMINDSKNTLTLQSTSKLSFRQETQSFTTLPPIKRSSSPTSQTTVDAAHIAISSRLELSLPNIPNRSTPLQSGTRNRISSPLSSHTSTAKPVVHDYLPPLNISQSSNYLLPTQQMHVLPASDIVSNIAFTSDLSRYSPIDSSDHINILLLGETGVGKSTFINAFANYLKFNSLTEAEQGRPAVIIPISFMITVGHRFDERIVKFGEQDESNNEDFDHPGQSVTQHCKSYILHLIDIRQTKLRIIDTPGFGDTRGVEQDERNMEHILEYVNNLTHLNAVCFLLKPNASRLNVFFRTCITQLFSLLSTSALDNIIFCFTNSRSTFYSPGDTAPLLRKMLNSVSIGSVSFKKENTFCFDNESFRYLVALRNGIKFDEYEREEYEASWKISVAQSVRLMHCIRRNVKIYRINPSFQSTKGAQIEIRRLIRPMLETIRHTLRNMILFKENSINLSIELHPKPIDSSSAICLHCQNRIIQVGKFLIPVDIAHQIRKHCLTCDCHSEQHIPVDYVLDYAHGNTCTSYEYDQMNEMLNDVCRACAEFSHYLIEMSYSSKEDLFLSCLLRLIRQEVDVCKSTTADSMNSKLVKELDEVKQKYEQELNRIKSMEKSIDLSFIYERIKQISAYPTIHGQVLATKDGQRVMFERSECEI